MKKINLLKDWIRGLGLVLATFLVVGCGNAPEAKPIVIVAESATTRTIEHTFGITEIPKNPERVIALGVEGMLADLLDIGIQPVMSIVNIPEYVPCTYSIIVWLMCSLAASYASRPLRVVS